VGFGVTGKGINAADSTSSTAANSTERALSGGIRDGDGAVVLEVEVEVSLNFVGVARGSNSGLCSPHDVNDDDGSFPSSAWSLGCDSSIFIISNASAVLTNNSLLAVAVSPPFPSSPSRCSCCCCSESESECVADDAADDDAEAEAEFEFEADVEVEVELGSDDGFSSVPAPALVTLRRVCSSEEVGNDIDLL
jgi:hypothetical protein